MLFSLQDVSHFLSYSGIKHLDCNHGGDITFCISQCFVTEEDDKLYFVDEKEVAVEIDSCDDFVAKAKTAGLIFENKYTIFRRSKDSTHASLDGSVIIKDKSVKKVQAKISSIIAAENVSEELNVVGDTPVVMPKLERKVPQRKPRKAKAIKEKVTADKKPKVKRKVSSGGKSIKTVVLEMITSDAEDSSIVEHIRLNFPESKFDINHVSWYRSTWFRDGIIEPKHAPRRSKVYKAWLRDSQKENTTAP